MKKKLTDIDNLCIYNPINMESKRINKMNQILIVQVILTLIGGILLVSMLTLMVLSTFTEVLTPSSQCNVDSSKGKFRRWCN